MARGSSTARAVRSPRTLAERTHGNLIEFPSFDEYKDLVAGWVIALRNGRRRDVQKSMLDVYVQVSAVRRSQRHQQLAEFIHHSMLALEGGAPEGAQYILLTTLAQFGWNVDLGGDL